MILGAATGAILYWYIESQFGPMYTRGTEHFKTYEECRIYALDHLDMVSSWHCMYVREFTESDRKAADVKRRQLVEGTEEVLVPYCDPSKQKEKGMNYVLRSGYSGVKGCWSDKTDADKTDASPESHSSIYDKFFGWFK